MLFFETTEPLMKESSTFSFRKSEPSTSQEQAVTTLIEKKGRDQRFIKNC